MIKTSKRKITLGRRPLDGYRDIAKIELKELKRLTITRAAKQTEVLLKLAGLWKK
jgi:hypothetical protein